MKRASLFLAPLLALLFFPVASASALSAPYGYVVSKEGTTWKLAFDTSPIGSENKFLYWELSSNDNSSVSGAGYWLNDSSSQNLLSVGDGYSAYQRYRFRIYTNGQWFDLTDYKTLAAGHYNADGTAYQEQTGGGTTTVSEYWSDQKMAQWFAIGLAFLITGWFAYQFRFTRYD